MTRMTLLGMCVGCMGWILFSVSESSAWDDSNDGGRAEESQASQAAHGEHAEVTRAVCVLQPVGDSGVTGIIFITLTDGSVTIEGAIEGLSPGEHGFHVHQFGDLTDQDAGESAGDHFNPHDEPHGRPEDPQHHAGDFGNIVANENGKAQVQIEIEDSGLELSGDHSVIGRALVVHAGADQFTQPSGNAGERVAFGVIGIAQRESHEAH